MAEKDIISKEIFKQIGVDIANLFFGFKITSKDQIEMLETEHQTIQDRRADLILKVTPKQGNAYILHIEIQNYNQKIMPQRMLRYYLDIFYANPNIQIHQYLIYIGKDRLRMQDGLKQDKLDYQYQIFDMRQLDCRKLFRQGSPDALVLAILCDFGGKPEKDIVNYIVKQLQSILKNNESEYRRFLLMLEILAENRNLQQQVKEAEQMITQVRLTGLPSYEIGLEAGIEKGIEKGKLEKSYQAALNLLPFLDDKTIADTLDLSIEEVKLLRKKHS